MENAITTMMVSMRRDWLTVLCLFYGELAEGSVVVLVSGVVVEGKEERMGCLGQEGGLPTGRQQLRESP